MITAPIDYKNTGVQRLAGFKMLFDPAIKTSPADLNGFVDIFCEYQLADNNYMNIHLEAGRQKDNADWFKALGLEEVLRFITYIIWTDKFVEGYLFARVQDKTLYHLLARLEEITASSVSPDNTP